MKKALILDLDNTLYSWMDAFADSFREQISFICDCLSIEEKTILRQFKVIFKKYDSVEVPNAVNQLSVWDTCALSELDSKQIQNESIKIFLDSWEKNITLFPNVEETLKWARESGFLIFAYTDAFAFWIDFRLHTLNIENYFDGIYALADDAISDSDVVVSSKRHCKITTFTQSQKKPNTDIVYQIIDKYDIKKEHVYFVGDSKTKDITTAWRAGVCDIWAKYGLKYKRESCRLLSLITPWERGTSGTNELQRKETPTHTIYDFKEIKAILVNMEDINNV
jgi:FMN phosphatase YigB (HAD superfamily)